MKTLPEIEFELICHPEDLPIEGNVQVSGDPDQDRETEDYVRSELESGNEWAWCRVEVRAIWGAMYGSAFLGGCSYKNQKDFEQDGYFEDMKAEALDNLKSKIASLKAKVDTFPENV